MNKARKMLKILFTFTLVMFLTLIISGIFIYKAEFGMVLYGDTSVLHKQNVLYLFTGVALGFFIIRFLFLTIPKYKKTNLWKDGWPLFLIFTIAQIAVIYFFRVKLTADWGVLYNISDEIINKNFTSLQRGGYLYAYPHNVGITLYYAIFSLLASNNIYILRFLNVVYSLIIVVLLNKTLILLNPKYKSYSRHFLITSCFFMPSIFFSNLVYNEVLSTMLFLLGIYLSIKLPEKYSFKTLIAITLAFSAGHFIRSIGYLFIVSTAVYFFLMKVDIQKILLFIIFTVIGFMLPLRIINSLLYSQNLISEKLGQNSIPLTKWVHMGLTEKYVGYWDQGESYWIYPHEAKWNKKEADHLYRIGIKYKITEHGWVGVANIYLKKIVWLWTEGTYQSVYLGMSHSSPGGYVEKTPVSNFFEADLKRREIFKVPMYFQNTIFLISIFTFLIHIIYRKKWTLLKKETILIITITAFIVFYLIWEVKPRYLYPVYPYLILLSFISLINIFNRERLPNKSP